MLYWDLLSPLTIYLRDYSAAVYIHACLVAQSCPALCDPMDCSPPGSSIHGIFSGKNAGVGCYYLLLIRDYYQQLYANKMDNLKEMDKFLEKYNFPKIEPGRNRKS